MEIFIQHTVPSVQVLTLQLQSSRGTETYQVNLPERFYGGLNLQFGSEGLISIRRDEVIKPGEVRVA